MAAVLNGILDRNKSLVNKLTVSKTNKTDCELQSDDNVSDDRMTLVQRSKKKVKSISLPPIAKKVEENINKKLQSDDNVSDDRMTLVQRSKNKVKSISLPPIAKKVEKNINENKSHRPSKILGSLTTSSLFTASKSIIKKLCVPAEEYGKVMTASNWPASVVIREWIFNKDNTNSSNTLPSAKTNTSAMKDVNTEKTAASADQIFE
ncbi:hypothetical protein HELRODRAFT_172854 [Helobdella robusta]|uniref:Uncharacterized protein n=1 Tax=Helobdella robusta TaxID=6412 RepID=T1F606_HELRO|nr:hypothetical protein HELRODRAFT_172854 [Helobdella robusta]ESO04467.1 hypothetical protein HELRODRAFT_172854 [Helobdella robusta]